MKEESSVQIKESDKIYCTSCGKIIKQEMFNCPCCNAKNKTTAGVLAIFLGALGVHKFYLKRVRTGIIYIAICLICFFPIVDSYIGSYFYPDAFYESLTVQFYNLLGIGGFLLLALGLPCIPVLIGFIDSIILLRMSNNKFNELYNK